MLKRPLILLAILVWVTLFAAAAVAAQPAGGFSTYLPLTQRGFQVPPGNLALVTRGFSEWDVFLAQPDGALTPMASEIPSGAPLRFSPDGDFLTFSDAGSDPATDHYVMSVTNPGTVFPLGDENNYYGVDWLPDSSGLFFHAPPPGGGHDRALYIATLPGLAHALVTGDYVSGVIADGGQFVYSTGAGSGAPRDIYRINRDGSGRVPLYTAATDDFVLEVLQDGRILFYASTVPDAGEFWIMNGDGTDARVLIPGPLPYIGLAAFGDHILYRGPGDRVTLINTAGEVRFQYNVPCIEATCFLYYVDWLPDHSEVFYIIFTQEDQGGQELALYRARTDGSDPAPRLVRTTVQNVDVSDDGRYLGYEADLADGRGVVLTDLVTGADTVIPSAGQSARFHGWRPRP